MADEGDPIVAWLVGAAEPPAGLAALVALPNVELDLLRALCRGQPARARLAAASLATLVARTTADAPTPPEPTPSEPTPSEPTLRPSPIPVADWQEGLRDAQEAALRVVALEEEVARLSPWLGVGWHTDGSALVAVVHERLDELERLLARRPDLARIADRLGRLEAEERRGRGSERGGRTTVVGVTVGGELADVLPNELALLGDPATEDLFYARLVERQLLSLELTGELIGHVPSARRPGPVIACIDTSGSMLGRAEELAKAATLAVLRRVLHAGRRARVLLFGGRGSVKELDFRPGRADARRLFDLLMASYHGGTDVDGPLVRALEITQREPSFARADLLLVTDGVARLHGSTTAALGRARASGLRLVVVRVGQRPVLLGDIADEVVDVNLESPGDSA